MKKIFQETLKKSCKVTASDIGNTGYFYADLLEETGLLLDLAAYSLISENNAAQYYPTYAYSHPLFTKQMHIYSDSKVSDFLAELTEDQRIGFVNEWNENRDHREKIYISYDSTNKNCRQGS